MSYTYLCEECSYVLGSLPVPCPDCGYVNVSSENEDQEAEQLHEYIDEKLNELLANFVGSLKGPVLKYAHDLALTENRTKLEKKDVLVALHALGLSLGEELDERRKSLEDNPN